MTADPRDPATWPRFGVNAPEDGWYLVWAPQPEEPRRWFPAEIEGHAMLFHLTRSALAVPLSTLADWRFYPTPITPANLRAEGEA